MNFTYQNDIGFNILPFTTNQLSEVLSFFPIQLKSEIEAILKETNAHFQYQIENRLVHFINIGEGLDYQITKQAIKSYIYAKKKQFYSNCSINLNFVNTKEAQQAIANGSYLAFYQISVYKTKTENALPESINFVNAIDKNLIEESLILSETQCKMMDWINAPSNFLRPETLAQVAQNSADKYGYSCQIWDKTQLEKEKFGAILAISRGSEFDPRFLLLHYKGNNDSEDTIALVGKGVTFDTGGISLKDSTNMHYMKCDMSGAAMMLGTIEMASRLKLKTNLIVALALTENVIGSKSIKPGDIVNAYNGNTIEIIDTDAEGRVVLADALAYVTKHYNTKYIISAATLTGSIVATLGDKAAGLFTHNTEISTSIYDSGIKTGEKVWPMPLWDDYKKDLDSDMADIKNYHGKPVFGAIIAAKFLEYFTDYHSGFCHLDIAGVAFKNDIYGTDKMASGYGIHLLINWLKNHIIK